jgi:hypothetical protein
MTYATETMPPALVGQVQRRVGPPRRLRGFQSGPYHSDDNATTLAHINAAQAALQKRTRERMARGVEGTHTV